jgi:hypothetical protein
VYPALAGLLAENKNLLAGRKISLNLKPFKMKNIKYLLVTLFFTITLTDAAQAQYSQAWTAEYDNGFYDYAAASVRDAAGNIYITGSSSNGTGLDLITVKYNSSGVQQWAARHTSGGTLMSEGLDITLDASGNVYVTGRGGNPTGVLAVKYNSSGMQQWATIYTGAGLGGNAGKTIKVDNMGNVYIGGEVYNGTSTQSDLIAIKLNSMGVIEWASAYNSAANEESREMAMDAAGNVYVCGQKSAAAEHDMVLSKWNSSGVHQWTTAYNGGPSDEANAILTDNSGNVIISGVGLNLTTIKYNSSGVQQWVAAYTGPVTNADAALDAVMDASGNIYIAGYTYTASGNSSILTVKYNSAGVQQWASTYEGPGNGDDEGWTLTVDSYGNVYTGGLSRGIGTHDDFTILKYNASGVQQWVSRTNGTGNLLDICRDILVDNQQNVYAAGLLYGTNGNCYLVKYSALTGIEQTSGETPSSYSLSQNYPNPFNPATNIELRIANGQSSIVNLSVYDISGRKIATLVNEPLKAGIYRYSFDGTGLNSGIYFYRLEAGEFSETRKMLLVK